MKLLKHVFTLPERLQYNCFEKTSVGYHLHLISLCSPKLVSIKQGSHCPLPKPQEHSLILFPCPIHLPLICIRYPGQQQTDYDCHLSQWSRSQFHFHCCQGLSPRPNGEVDYVNILNKYRNIIKRFSR